MSVNRTVTLSWGLIAFYAILSAWVLLLSSGCAPSPDYRPVAACELGMATLADTMPLPAPAKCSRCNGTGYIVHGDGHQTPCPECNDGDPGPPQGVFDSIRDAKELVAKGNALADRLKTQLDAAERAGKITVEVPLPAGPKAVAEEQAAEAVEAGGCTDGSCNVGGGWGFFRRRR